MPVFYQARAKFYPFNEVYLEAPKKETKVAGDSPAKHFGLYIPNTEIVSHKYTRLSEVSEETAIRYLQELTDKYASGSIIAEVSSKMSSAMPVSSKRRTLRGQMIASIQKKINSRPRQKLKFETSKTEFFKRIA